MVGYIGALNVLMWVTECDSMVKSSQYGNGEAFIGGVFSIMLFDKGNTTLFGVIVNVHTLCIVVVEQLKCFILVWQSHTYYFSGSMVAQYLVIYGVGANNMVVQKHDIVFNLGSYALVDNGAKYGSREVYFIL